MLQLSVVLNKTLTKNESARLRKSRLYWRAQKSRAKYSITFYIARNGKNLQYFLLTDINPILSIISNFIAIALFCINEAIIFTNLDQNFSPVLFVVRY